jgi:hypothetical protein
VDLQESSIKPPVSRPRGPSPQTVIHRVAERREVGRNSRSTRLGVEHVRQVARVHRDAVYAAVQKPVVWRMENRTYAPGTYLAETTFF